MEMIKWNRNVLLQNRALRHYKQRDVGSVWIKDEKRIKTQW